jgi:hypothetical protein
MDRRNDLLAELARDAALERSEYLVRAGEQLERFLRQHRDRLRELGGLVLVDDDSDYLAIAPDGTFRSRARELDPHTGEWVSETEIIETGGELVELYNPNDLFAWFADAAEAEAFGEDGADLEGDAEDAEDESGALADEDTTEAVEDPYAGAADRWAARGSGPSRARGGSPAESAAAALYELALDFQERSQAVEAGLITGFETAAGVLTDRLPPIVVVDDLDEHLELGPTGFSGRVIAEGETGWTDISRADQIVRFYDPTDVFGDLADAIAETWPAAAGPGGEADEADGSDA